LPGIKLHIIALDIPYPLDYGAAIDIYYRIRYLHDAGAEIYLHCFQYNKRQESAELNKWCKEVWYYPRKTGWRGLSPITPYMIYSRRDPLLLKRLQEIDAPIFFEGVHCSYYKSDHVLKKRFKVIRNHNIEHDYFEKLYQKEKHLLKKLYYKIESLLLIKYEYHLQDIQAFLPISTSDLSFFRKLYPHAKFSLTPPFHPYKKVLSATGKGSYCLFHGNLAHIENSEAVFYLLKEVFSKINVPFIIAGRNPSEEMKQACAFLPNCKLIESPATDEMEQLMKDAQVHVMITFQPTGMKTKLLIALFYGRHILANDAMLQSTALESTCSIANTSEAMSNKIMELMDIPFTEADILLRAEALEYRYNNDVNARRILSLLPT
jgi:hypothetical protein